MAIIFNGTTVSDISYNGVALDKVIFNGVTVFEKVSVREPESGEYFDQTINSSTMWKVIVWKSMGYQAHDVQIYWFGKFITTVHPISTETTSFEYNGYTYYRATYNSTKGVNYNTTKYIFYSIYRTKI